MSALNQPSAAGNIGYAYIGYGLMLNPRNRLDKGNRKFPGFSGYEYLNVKLR
jgi:hypothetical protein